MNLQVTRDGKRFWDDAVRLAAQHQLYGRADSIATMLESLERISRGSGEVLLIPGISGTGKTCLAQVLAEPARTCNGSFIQGKFNQYDQNVPYVAWRQALSQFCEMVNREDDLERMRWIRDIRDAVGENGQLLIDLVPEFYSLLGQQVPVAAISPQEARHRFASVIRSLLHVICRAEYPLVLFIDDWQWADAASLHLLTQLQVGSTLRYLLIIAAYRCDEIDSAHPWSIALADLRNLDVPVNMIETHQLSVHDLQRLVSDKLALGGTALQKLSHQIYTRTEGNPFFAQTLIGMLENKHQDLKGCDFQNDDTEWQSQLPQNVVDLFSRRIAMLDEDTQDLLSLAACLGHRFELETLSMISDRTPEDCEALLKRCVSNLIIPPEGEQQGTGGSLPGTSKWFQFLHDRVQQAAYARIDVKNLPEVKFKIARRMLEKLSDDQMTDRACELVEHLNAGLTLIPTTDELVQGIRLNVVAARKARSATAFRAALQYHRAARRYLESPALTATFWRDHHVLAMDLFREQAETEFLEGDREEAERCVRKAVAQARTPIQKADTLRILIIQHTLHANYADAIATGREALAALGVFLPEDKFEIARDQEIAAIRHYLKDRSVAELAKLPFATDPIMCAMAQILITMGPPCYRSHQSLWSVIVSRVVNLTLQFGHIPQVGYSHTAFAGLLGWVANDYDTGREFGELATQLISDSSTSASEKSVFRLMIGSSVRHWFEHLRQSSEDYAEAFQIGSQSGNLQYAAYAFGHNMYCRFYQGTPLDVLIRETQCSQAFSQSRHNQWAIDLLEGGLRIFEELSEKAPAECSSCEWEADYLRRLESHQNHQVICIYRVLKVGQSLLSGNYRQALTVSDEVQPMIHTVGTQGLLPWAEYVFSRLLAITGQLIADGVDPGLDRQKELDQLLGQLRVWADYCPDNFEHKYLLATAELAWLEGRFVDAMELYQQAIDSAHEGDFVHWEGFANDRAACFWRAMGNGRFEQIYWQQAYHCFDRWGSRARLLSLKVDYRAMLSCELRSVVPRALHKTGLPQDSLQQLVERHVELFEERAEEIASVRGQVDSARNAEELAQAADTLRANVAERRRTAAELRRQRDAQRDLNNELERRVQERTAELTIAEARFRKVLDTAPIAMVMMDETGRIVLLNSEAERLFGYPRSQLVGRSVDSLIPAWRQESLENYNTGEIGRPLLQQQQLMTGQNFFGVHQDGSEFPVEIGLKLVETAEGMFVLSTIADITVREQILGALKSAKEDAEAANRAKSEFLANMSHELRTPMTAILGFNDILLDNLTTLEDIDAARTIKENGEYLITLINDILDLSKIESGNLEIECIRFSPRELVAEVASLMDVRAKAKNLPLQVWYEGPIPESIQSDPTRLRQILINLVGNAIKFTELGKVQIVARFLNVFGQGPKLQFDVIDTGIGIDSRSIDKIFRPFIQADSSTTRRFGGTGLGLAITKRLVKRLGGELSVSSTIGMGSTFSVTISAAPVTEMGKTSNQFKSAAAAVGAQATKDTDARLRQRRILVAEDNPVNQRLINFILKKAGAEVTLANNGQIGLELAIAANLEGTPFDVILMDMQMPVLDGYEATMQLRNDGYCHPIIALTAHAMDSDCQKCLTAGCDDYTTKPIDRKIFIELIAKVCEAGERRYSDKVDIQRSMKLLQTS